VRVNIGWFCENYTMRSFKIIVLLSVLLGSSDKGAFGETALVRTREVINVYKILGRKTEGNKSIGITKRRFEIMLK
jgi:hypothetical protein